MKKTILAIDDDKEILVLEDIILTRAGYQVYTALGGKEALIVLKDLKEINLILLDYEMDGMNGPEFLEAFEKQYPVKFKNTPVIFVSAHEDSLLQKTDRTFIPKLKDLDNFVKDVARFVSN